MWPAIITAAATLGGMGIEYAANKKLTEQEHENNRDMFKLQSDYNSIEAQRRRAESAGLNPGAVFSSGNPSTAGSLAQGGKAHHMSVTDNVLQGLNAYSRIKTEKAERDLMDKQADLLDVQASGVGLDNERKRMDNAVTKALDEAVITVPGLGTYTGARLVQGVSVAKTAIIESFSKHIGYKSLENEYSAKKEFDLWRSQSAFESNILYDCVFADLKRRTDLRLDNKQIDLMSKQIADLGSQMVYRTQMANISAQRLVLDRKRYTLDCYTALSHALVEFLTQEEQVRHNKASERLQALNIRKDLVGIKARARTDVHRTKIQGLVGAGQILTDALGRFVFRGGRYFRY